MCHDIIAIDRHIYVGAPAHIVKKYYQMEFFEFRCSATFTHHVYAKEESTAAISYL